jgi:hypothetical protein
MDGFVAEPLGLQTAYSQQVPLFRASGKGCNLIEALTHMEYATRPTAPGRHRCAKQRRLEHQCAKRSASRICVRLFMRVHTLSTQRG